MSAHNDRSVEEDSDDEFDWEEVDVVPASAANLDLYLDHEEDQAGPSNPTRGNIEITIQGRSKPDEAAKKRAARLQAERAMRLDCHKMHTICLIANARIRNQWLNDELLQARLLSLTPIALQNAFIIPKTKVPEAPMRGRMFESAVTQLAEWWQAVFEIETTGHLRNRTFEEVQKLLSEAQSKVQVPESDDEDEEEPEIIRSEKSLMKHALMKRGSRDTSAQLFTALCRALGIPSRLVASLQSVPWQASAGKPKKTYKRSKGKGKQKATEEDDDDDLNMEEVSIPGSPISAGGKGKQRETMFPGAGQSLNGSARNTPPDTPKKKAPPVITLRKSKGRKLGSSSVAGPARKPHPPDPTTSAPVFWTEVFSRADGRWFPVDPIRGIVNKRKLFDPDQSSNPHIARDPNVKIENRMVYVIALEEDGYARDVTPRYAREYGAKVSKVQQGGKGRKRWWEMILGAVTRPYRLNRDDVEDEEIRNHQLSEQMPTSINGFKDHPLYVLTRHLKRDEVIYPLTELGKFRGEPVYARSSIISLKAADNWMRQGRKIQEGCQPMKWVKPHAVTVNKKRAIEAAMDHGDGDNEGGIGSEKDVMQGLYAQNQTELYKADPVVDGIVPKNNFGNIDLYVPSMLPAGDKGTAKVARQLGFDFAEAVTGFEFKKRRAFPLITGIVVAAENEEAVLEAFWEAEHEAEKKRNAKRQEQVIKRWTRLVQGLRIRQRLQAQYADRSEQPSGEATPVVNSEDQQVVLQEAGGFLVGADDVVQPYSLPRDIHDKAKTPPPVTSPAQARRATETEPFHSNTALEVAEDNLDEDLDMVEAVIPAVTSVPKTMRELAQDAEREREETMQPDPGEDISLLGVSTPDDGVNGRTNDRPANGTVKAARAGGSRKAKTPSTPTDTPRSAKSRKRPHRDASHSEEDSQAIEVSVRRAAKRARPTPTPIVKSDRVLRARKGKSEDILQEEREQEQAYRAAIAG
ncbi:hypothetical protein EUX98_g6882 [Antrodiella citrinella]|uniref:Rad4 beta-hairpin domain-containing protein n=1 Tax=Antrodiella citrinella TaxID=2447956 RepID=A0A4S4MPN8_9APHY|nr:hypothetical protein EUX98_g6882 [Antrodiella citrinella]